MPELIKSFRWITSPAFPTLVGVVASFVAASCAPTTSSNDPLAQPQGGPPVSLVVANSDLAVGENRVSFGLVDREYMPVRPDTVEMRAVYYEPGAETGQVRHRSEAEFLGWPPDGSRGVFIAQVTFNQAGTATAGSPGIWELHVTFDYPEQEALTIGTAVSVASEHSVPSIGDPAPLSNTPTDATAGDLHTISSSPEPDPTLYKLSIAEAVESGRPAVITFATPAFCVSATCGPQVSDISKLAGEYRGRANFVHVEVYKDPHLIEPTNPSRELAPAVAEWGLVSEPWTFVVDREGTIHARFEQYVPPAVLESALLSALHP